MIDSSSYCFCMQCDCSEPQAGSGCGRCLQRERECSDEVLRGRCKQKLLDIGTEQAKEGKGKPLSWDLNEDTDWLTVEVDDVS